MAGAYSTDLREQVRRQQSRRAPRPRRRPAGCGRRPPAQRGNGLKRTARSAWTARRLFSGSRGAGQGWCDRRPDEGGERAFPRRWASCTTRKEAGRGGGFSRETPRCGLGRERSGCNWKPSGVSTCTSREPSSSRAYPPRARRTALRPQPLSPRRARAHPHPSAWTRAPFATLPSIAGRTVLCRTSAGVRTTTSPRASEGPRRAARPRRACRGLERPRAAGTGRDAPFGDRGRVPSVPGRDVDLVGLDPALRPRRREPGGGPAPEPPGHGLHVGPAQARPPGDLPVGEVQAREAGARRPDPRRPAAAGRGGAGQVVGGCCARSRR